MNWYLIFKRKVFLRGVDFLKKIKINVPPFPSVSAIIVKGNKILLVRLTYKQGFALPGGMLHGNEDFEKALKREVWEETGLRVTKSKYFGTYAYKEEYYSVNVAYIVEATGKLRGSREGEPVWMESDEALKNLVYKDNQETIRSFLKSRPFQR